MLHLKDIWYHDKTIPFASSSPGSHSHPVRASKKVSKNKQKNEKMGDMHSKFLDQQRQPSDARYNKILSFEDKGTKQQMIQDRTQVKD